jgi:microcystin-dependent protein
MPSSNGVYSLPVGYLAVTGGTIQASQHNPPLEDIAAALTGRLSRDGTAPMTGALALAAGTVAAPGLAFAADPTSGFYDTPGGFGVAVAGVKVAEFLAGGILGAKLIGELFAFTGTTIPPLCVFPTGQTLSRTTYAALWAFAQVEIAAGNLFYNNGNGSTTFGIGNLQGRVIACTDFSGAVLNSAVMTPDGSHAGAIGGAQVSVLATPNLPPYTPAGTNTGGSALFSFTTNNFQLGTSNGINGITQNSGFATLFQQPTFTGTPQGGTSTAFSNAQPTVVFNYALFAGA